MTTKFVGMKELRHHMAKLTSEATRKRERLIVLRKNRPIFELRPLSEDDVALWSFDHDLEQARESARAGKTHSTKDVRKMLGLKPYDV